LLSDIIDRIFIVDTNVTNGEDKMMQARVQRWGNSLAVRIPKPFAQEIGLEQNSLVTVSISEGKLLLEPILEPTYTLEQLLAEVTDDNLHQEIETGPTVGHEVW
jgi:antitoxin MazE